MDFASGNGVGELFHIECYAAGGMTPQPAKMKLEEPVLPPSSEIQAESLTVTVLQQLTLLCCVFVFAAFERFVGDLAVFADVFETNAHAF